VRANGQAASRSMILGRRLRDCDPDDEHEDGDAVGDNRRVGKGDHNHGQSTGRGDNNRDDNRRIESRLSFYFERKFLAQMLWQRGKLRQIIAKSVLVKGACVREGNQGQCSRQKLRQRHLHGSWVRAKT
jgi:hypothetical protein